MNLNVVVPNYTIDALVRSLYIQEGVLPPCFLVFRCWLRSCSTSVDGCVIRVVYLEPLSPAESRVNLLL